MHHVRVHGRTSWQRVTILSLVVLGCHACAKDTGVMTRTEENKALVRRVVDEGVNAGNLTLLRETLSSDYVRHSQATTGMPEIRGADAMLTFVGAHLAAFPDWHETIDLMIAEDDKVAYITTGTGTHTGPMGNIPPTGNKVEVVNYVVQRIQDGKIAETWIGWDNLAVLTQLGLFPPRSERSERSSSPPL